MHFLLQEETASTGTDWDLTYNYTKTLAFMNDRTAYYNTTGFTSAYKHFLEVNVLYVQLFALNYILGVFGDEI